MNVIRILTRTKIKHKSVFSNSCINNKNTNLVFSDVTRLCGALLCAASVFNVNLFLLRDSQSARGHRHRLTRLAAVRAGKQSTEVTELSRQDKIRMKLNMSSSGFGISITLLFLPSIATYLTLY